MIFGHFLDATAFVFCLQSIILPTHPGLVGQKQQSAQLISKDLRDINTETSPFIVWKRLSSFTLMCCRYASEPSCPPRQSRPTVSAYSGVERSSSVCRMGRVDASATSTLCVADANAAFSAAVVVGSVNKVVVACSVPIAISKVSHTPRSLGAVWLLL